MMKVCCIVRALRLCSAVCLFSVLAGCSGGGGEKFDGEKAPYGPKTATTQLQSVLTISGGGLLSAASISQNTAVVGQTTIRGVAYDRLATTRDDDPSKGGEY